MLLETKLQLNCTYIYIYIPFTTPYHITIYLYIPGQQLGLGKDIALVGVSVFVGEAIAGQPTGGPGTIRTPAGRFIDPASDADAFLGMGGRAPDDRRLGENELAGLEIARGDQAAAELLVLALLVGPAGGLVPGPSFPLMLLVAVELELAVTAARRRWLVAHGARARPRSAHSRGSSA